MCVSTQHQVEPSVSRLAIDLWRVGQKDGNAALWNLRRRFLDVVRTIEMRVVDPREVDRILAPSNRDAFVEEDYDAQSLKVGNHLDRVMITEHAIDGAMQRGSQLGDKLKRRSIVAVSPTTEVSGQNAKVVFEALQ